MVLSSVIIFSLRLREDAFLFSSGYRDEKKFGWRGEIEKSESRADTWRMKEALNGRGLEILRIH